MIVEITFVRQGTTIHLLSLLTSISLSSVSPIYYYLVSNRALNLSYSSRKTMVYVLIISIATSATAEVTMQVLIAVKKVKAE